MQSEEVSWYMALAMVEVMGYSSAEAIQ
jgi:hypothetical protein